MKSIVMDSEYASMGRWISVVVGKACGLKLYERADVVKVLDDPALTPEFLDRFDESLLRTDGRDLACDASFNEVRDLLDCGVAKAMGEGPCIIHELGASRFVDAETGLRVMLYNDDVPGKIRRAKTDPLLPSSCVADEDVAAFMDAEDRKRAVYHDAIVDTPWGAKEGYDLCLNTAVLGREKTAELLIEALREPRLSSEDAKSLIRERFERVI